MKKLYILLLLISSLTFSLGAESREDGQIIIENSDFRLILGKDGTAVSLVHKPSGQECLETSPDVPAFTVTQYRPYDNELQLSYPAKSKTFPAKSIARKGDSLLVEFDLISHIATIGLNITEDYIGFSLDKLDYRLENYGTKRVTPVDELTFLQLPVKERKNFGEWLNVMWDGDVAVNLLATNQFTRIDGYKNPGYQLLNASAVGEVKILGTGCALIATSTDKLMERIRAVEEDYGLPEGVRSRQRPEYKWSYYELRSNGKLLQTIDRNIEYAKKGGFRIIVIYYPDFAQAAGHFDWRAEFPNGIDDLRKIAGKIKAAGLIPGFHMHYNKAGKADPYVTPVPDHRLNLRRIFTLASPLDSSAETICVEEDPSGSTLDDQRRFLKIGNELISYEGYTTTRPYSFTGCTRGALKSRSGSYETGFKFGILDVDTWPVFVRFDQRSSIQEEVAERIGKLYADAGFEFVYFDGAEDIHAPYWFHGANAQYQVYKALNPSPLFAEGAMKAHFSWHMLTRGNAFDTFRPEVIKEATRRYPLAEAAHISKDFTALNFGWMSYVAPGEDTTGSQPDMYEYVTSHAAGWNCPVSLVASLDQMEEHPRTPDNLEVLKRWEDVRNTDFLSDEIKSSLRDPDKEHILLLDEEGQFELQECAHLAGAAGGNADMRAFIFDRAGKTYVAYWHTSGEAVLELKINPDRIKLHESIGTLLPLQNNPGGILIPLRGRLYLEFDIPRDEAIHLLREARIIPSR